MESALVALAGGVTEAAGAFGLACLTFIILVVPPEPSWAAYQALITVVEVDHT